MTDELHEAFDTYEEESDLRRTQDRICAANIVSVVVFEDEAPPPYVAHVYLHDDAEHHCADVWAGTVWREDRWPSVEEIASALVRWRGHGPAFRVAWWQEP